MSQKFADSKTSGAHHALNQLTGNWQGIAKTWFEPDSIADESPVSGTIRVIYEGRFAIHEYTGSLGGKPLAGMAIIGYNLSVGKYESAWIDSFHTGTAIMFSQGEKGNKAMSFLGGYDYVTPETEQRWGWRTEIEMPDENSIVMTAYNISPEGEESKATEIVYKRT